MTFSQKGIIITISLPKFTCSKSTLETTLTLCEIYSKLTIKTPERLQSRRSGVFVINFEQISRIFLTPFSTVSIAGFQQVNTGWVCKLSNKIRRLNKEKCNVITFNMIYSIIP